MYYISYGSYGPEWSAHDGGCLVQPACERAERDVPVISRRRCTGYRIPGRDSEDGGSLCPLLEVQRSSIIGSRGAPRRYAWIVWWEPVLSQST